VSVHPVEWSFVANGVELRIMMLPERRNLYLVMIDSEGMRAVARTLGDREAAALVSWLSGVTGGEQADG
jgi:hypothetical protein